MTILPKDRAPYFAIADRPPLKLRVETLLPDVLNWSWHEYGMRVGEWRFFELYQRLAIRPPLSINARDEGWELTGRVHDQMPIHKVANCYQGVKGA